MTVADPAGRLPVVFVPHGGGPWPFVEMGINADERRALIDYLRAVAALPLRPPSALLVVSAHWEQPIPTVLAAPRPPLLYDYVGFPPESYELTWPAPGAPALAARVCKLLANAGFPTAQDDTRGFDHGTFVPLKVTYPAAEIPTIQLSLMQGLDPEEHLRMGRALASLRNEGVFIIGSGMSYHNMRGFGRATAKDESRQFDTWLRHAVEEEPVDRDRLLAEWTKAPAARLSHPREEHLLPLMVVAGAAGEDRGTTSYNDLFMGVHLSAFHFG